MSFVATTTGRRVERRECSQRSVCREARPEKQAYVVPVRRLALRRAAWGLRFFLGELPRARLLTQAN